MVSYGFYHKHQGWAFSFPYIRSVASSILFYVTFYQLHMPSQDVIPHHLCSGLANEPFLKYFRDLSTLADCDTDKSIDAASKLACRLYDQKGKLKEDHVDLNKLTVRLATLRDACLAKLPPCEATFTQHILRSSLQINIWMTAHVAKPPMKYTVLCGWEDRNGLVPVYFKGQMSSDFLQDLVCTCKGKSVCMKGCICFEQSLSCTYLCP